jgi:hypothetical protein
MRTKTRARLAGFADASQLPTAARALALFCGDTAFPRSKMTRSAWLAKALANRSGWLLGTDK